MSNFQSNVYLAKPIIEVRSQVLARWGGVDSGARGDSRHCPSPSSHNAAAGGCAPESAMGGVSYHPNYVHAWDWGHNYASGYKQMADYLLHGPLQKYIRYIIIDSTIRYPDHRGGGSEPSSGHTWHIHISWMPGTHNLTATNWFGAGTSPKEEFPMANNMDTLGKWMQEQRAISDANTLRLFQEQNDRNAVLLGMILSAVEGDADLAAFEAALLEDRQARAVQSEELRSGIKKDVTKIIADLDAIDGAPADEIAQAVADIFAERMSD